jgi:hypothetical protein
MTAPRYLLVVTTDGYGKRLPVREITKQRHRGGMGVKVSSAPVAATIVVTGAKGDLVLMSAVGKVERIAVADVPVRHRHVRAGGTLPKGVRIMRLDPGDEVAAATVPEELVVASVESPSDDLEAPDPQVAEALEAIEELERRYRQEDKEHQERLQDAQRQGRTSGLKDKRTPPEKRQAELAAAEERAWAAALVLAEVVDVVIELQRAKEEDFLADLRSQLEPAREKLREAERLHHEANVAYWHLHQLGEFVQRTAEGQDGAFGLQPAPTPSLPPAQFDANAARSMLERPWHRQRPDAQTDEPVTAWQQKVRPGQDENDTGDRAA